MVFNQKSLRTSNVEAEGEKRRGSVPVALLRSVVRERVGGEVVEERRRPAGEFQRVKAPPNVGKDLRMTGTWLRKPTTRIFWPQGHSSGSTSYTRRIGCAHDFKASRKPSTVGLRGIGRLVLRRDLLEGGAPSRDSPVGVQPGAVAKNEMRSPVGNVGSETGDPLEAIVVPVVGGCPLLPLIGDGALGKVPHFRLLGRIDAEATGCGLAPVPRRAPRAMHPQCRESPSVVSQ